MRRIIAALAFLALAATAMGQNTFPYATCTKQLSKSTYSVVPSTTFPAANTICWTIKYSAAQCTVASSCCSTNVHKFELDVKPSCMSGFKATGTLNGKATVAPAIMRPPNANATQAVLYVTSLNLDSTNADGAQLCVTITKGSCTTLSALTVNPIWSAALFDASHVCCPVIRGASPPPPSPPPPSPPPPPPPRPPPPSPPPPSPPPPSPPPPSPPPPSPPPPSPPPPSPPPPSPPPPSPPPPSPPPPSPPPPSPPPPRPPPPSPPPPSPPPPSPPPPSPPPPCSACLTWEVVGNLAFFDNVDNCNVASAAIKSILSSFKTSKKIISGFDTATCNGNYVQTCGSFWSVEAGAQVANALQGVGSGFVVSPVFGYTTDCPAVLAGYAVRLVSNNAVCANVQIDAPACAPPTTTFPFCVCNKESGATPFALQRQITETVGVNTNTYCVGVESVTPNAGKCGQQTVMKKAEFYFDQTKRFQLVSINVRYNNGTSFGRSQSWGPTGDNTLKVSDLNWSAADVAALEPEICFELKKTTTLEQFSMDPQGYIWASLFDPNQNCCPTYYGVVY
ncbi:hypothetical protein Agub_g12144 [Astrephomene gubernaculifera]|uniref:Pherophorin domain-containing protein n=1 Tax=Astrephomene gubernaculifera TaxID=47775 RepID=A0AAD3DZS3_9CHLO|nr:hypothetical protein Agub_g12144 [Astrephomene gubernaculifera]